ncbi:MAG: tRNA (adenosine(37)-N6)-threonylcarbamoyltransferase complex ATPase subunit type 1 TsaE [Opitutales bacterium]|jgi:tRNA threonylcarbamoyladenosine biosynthesis protein TsaE
MHTVPAPSPATDVLNRFHAGWTTRSPAETEAAGVALASLFPADHALALHGGLGAGKTTFVRGLARGWDLAGPILSPTFNYFFIYRGPRQLVHLDAYRLARPADADSLLVDEFLQSPWCLAIEWPENLGDRLPRPAWHLDFHVPDETARILTLRRVS